MKATSFVVVTICVVLFCFSIFCDGQNVFKKRATMTPKLLDTSKPIFSSFSSLETFQSSERSWGLSGASNLYELLPGRYSSIVSLPGALEGINKTPGGRRDILLLVEYFQNLTGIALPPFAIDLILDNAPTFCDYLALSPRQIHELMSAVGISQGSYENIPPGPNMKSGFVFPNDIETTNINMSLWIPTIQPLGEYFWTGFVFPNTTTIQQAKTNIIMSFIFNQLSANSHLNKGDDLFTVIYQDKPYVDLKDFLTAILQSSPSANVTTYITKRLAAFFGLYVKEKGELKQVADPLMVRTLKYNAAGKEVIIPAVHTEYVTEVTLPDVNFELVWYEGQDGIGFLPSKMYELGSWLGKIDGPLIVGNKAIDTIQSMGLYSDILLQIAYKRKLFDWGYAITGACSDGCGVVEVVTDTTLSEYPNVITKPLVIPEVLLRLEKQDRYSSFYYKLLAKLSTFPVDWNYDNYPDTNFRILSNIPWKEGEEPFQCVVDARTLV